MKSHSAVTFSKGILSIPYLGSLLNVDSISKKSRFFSRYTRKENNEIVIGWGLKANTGISQQYAASNNLPYLTLEDGFLRSIGLGVDNCPPLSVVIDDLGIYYDATRPSRLEKLLNNKFDDVPELPPFNTLHHYANGISNPLDNEELISRARQCIKQIIDNQLSKYNSSPELILEPTDKQRILVVDQTSGDLSIQHGLATSESFTQMLDVALAEHPEAEILVKIHPDVVAGKKHSHLLQAGTHPRVHLLNTDCNPIALLKQIDHVYVVTSQLGFEALMAGKPVTCFGAPFYAGWGLTDDRIQLARRSQKRTLEQLFVAAYMLYSHYRDPETGEPCEIERIIDHLALQRCYFIENSGVLYCYGFTLWKRGYVRRYLQSPWNQIHFVSSAWQIRRRLPQKDAHLVVWGARESESILKLSKKYHIPIWKMEDGFLRSVGLGSDLTAPASLVLDKKGIYFDPGQASDLETILQNNVFSADEIQRAQLIKKTLIHSEISKYNVGERKTLVHSAKPGQRIILVPGQVEGDASIRLGCTDIRTNNQLLQAVRENAPDAYLIYKPHPDVLSGNRKGLKKTGDSPNFDQLVTDISISRCLDNIDEVHTMTSLVGFEGLLRNKQVTTYGLPFYAGWGLTNDKNKLERRSRVLTIDELVAGCMIGYPRYINVRSGTFSSPETTIKALEQQRSMATNETQIISSIHSRMVRKLMNLIQGLMNGK